MTTEQSPSVAALAAALAKAQASIENAKRTSDNPFFKSKYADLADVRAACQSQLSANQLSVIQTCEVADGGVIVATTLVHASGEWIRGRLKVRPVKDDAQSVGSAITYARRYSLAAIVGVATEDDDGEAAHGRDAQDAPARHQEPPKPAPKATPKPSEAYPRRPMQDATGVTVETVKEKGGTTQKGKPYKLFFIKFSDGVECSTFDDKAGQFAVTAAQLGTPVAYAKKASAKYPDKWELVSIEDAPSAPADDVPPTPAEDSGIPF